MEKPFLLPPLCPSKQFWPKQSLEKQKKANKKTKQNNTSIENQHMLTTKKKPQNTTNKKTKQNKTKITPSK